MPSTMDMLPIPVTERSKARWDCGFESRQKNMDVCLLLVLCVFR